MHEDELVNSLYVHELAIVNLLSHFDVFPGLKFEVSLTF